jgi:hypothetical protein
MHPELRIFELGHADHHFKEKFKEMVCYFEYNCYAYLFETLMNNYAKQLIEIKLLDWNG